MKQFLDSVVRLKDDRNRNKWTFLNKVDFSGSLF